MSGHAADDNLRPAPDPELVAITDYVCDYEVTSAEALDTARNCLMDSLGCALLALQYPECTKHLGPLVDGTIVLNGARVPGTQFQLDPVKAAWDIGALVRWLDFNDTWLAAEWGHPSDNLGALLGLSDWLSRRNVAAGKAPLIVGDVLTAMVKAHEIQGVLALENSFNQVGLDPRGAGEGRLRGPLYASARRFPGAGHRCPVPCLGGRAESAHLPARAEHRVAQVLGVG